MLDEKQARALIDMHETQVETVRLLARLHHSIAIGYTTAVLLGLAVGIGLGVLLTRVNAP